MKFVPRLSHPSVMIHKPPNRNKKPQRRTRMDNPIAVSRPVHAIGSLLKGPQRKALGSLPTLAVSPGTAHDCGARRFRLP
jgi:hypothetical protein